jgi:hypothetical protein
VKAWISAPTIAAGVALGLLAAPLTPIVTESWRDWYDGLHPVIRAQVRVVSVDEHRAVINMQAEKLRECEYVRLVAYTIDMDGIRRDATVRRIDTETRGITRGVGKYDLGQWEVYPRLGGRMVRIESVHDCDGRQVRTLLGQVELL